MCNLANPILDKEPPLRIRTNPRFRALPSGAVPRLAPSGRRGFVSRSRFLLSVVAGLLLLGASPAAGGTPQATFDGVASILNTGGITLAGPSGVAVDPSGNVYIADQGHNQIVKVNPQGVASVVAIGSLSPGLNQPTAVAVDSAGNLYIADSGNNRVVEVSSSGSGSVLNMGSVTLNNPRGVAVAASGNVYIADTNNNRIMEVPSGGTATVLNIAVSPSPTTLSQPVGLAVDISGNLYIADLLNLRIVKVAAGGTAGSVLSITGLGTPILNPVDVAVDGLGNVYIADDGNSRIVEVTPAGAGSVLSTGTVSLETPMGVAVDIYGTVYIADTGLSEIVKVAASAVGFGHLQLGTASGVTQTLPFTVAGSITLGSVAAFTLGTENLDFTLANGTTCTSGTTHTTCNVNMQFLPTAPGLRRGAVVLFDNAIPPNPLLTVPLYGFADAPVAALAPHTASVINTGGVGLDTPNEVALDGSGNIYVANSLGSNVVEIPPGGGSASVVSTSGITLGEVGGVALDGAGNLFIADTTYARIVVVTPGGVASVLSISSLSTVLDNPFALNFDAAGNLYVADYGNSRIVKVSSLAVAGATSSGAGSVIDTGSYPLGDVPGVAVDPAGTVYIADALNNRVVKVTAAGVASLLVPAGITPGLSQPGGVGVDAMGNVYVADTLNNRIVEVTTAGVASVVSTPGLPSPSTGIEPYGVTVDPSGNIFIPDTDNNRIVEVPVSGATLAFASTYVGLTSTDSPQTATVTNLGNLPLVFGANPTYTLNFSENLLDTNLCASATPLSAGTVCDVSVDFTPQSPGSLSAGITVGDNALNVATSTQQVSVGAVAEPSDPVTPTISWSPPLGFTYGHTLSGILDASAASGTAPVAGSFTYTATPSGGTASTVSSATVLVVGSYTLTATFTPTDTTDYNSVSASVPLTVTKGTPTVSLASSLNPVLYMNPVTFTATVSSPTSTPTGTVSFYDGTSPLSSPETLVQGVATYTTSSLVAATHSITVIYSGDANFSGTTSPALAQTVEDFTLSFSSLPGVAAPTVFPGGTATYTLQVGPSSGLNFPSAVTFTISGLPAGAKATFTPASLPAGSAGTNVTLIIQLANQVLAHNPANPLGRGLALAMAGGMFLLPFGRRLRRSAGRAGRFAGLLLLMLAATCAALGLTACGGGGNGYFGQQVQNYTLTVTATSGALSHSTTVNLTVQ